MIDVLTFSIDRTKIGPEVAQKFPEKFNVETGDFLVTKIPTRKNGLKSLCLVRCRTDQDVTDLQTIQAIQVLGTYDEVFSDTGKLAQYDSVYDRSPVTYTIDGIDYTHTPPDYIGVFA
jgi:hypothetical protein